MNIEPPISEPKKNQVALDAWVKDKTLLCDKCACDMPGGVAAHGDIEFAGAPCTQLESVEKSKQNPWVWIVCKSCLDAMPDAGNLFLADGVEVEITEDKPVIM